MSECRDQVKHPRRYRGGKGGRGGGARHPKARIALGMKQIEQNRGPCSRTVPIGPASWPGAQRHRLRRPSASKKSTPGARQRYRGPSGSTPAVYAKGDEVRRWCSTSTSRTSASPDQAADPGSLGTPSLVAARARQDPRSPTSALVGSAGIRPGRLQIRRSGSSTRLPHRARGRRERSSTSTARKENRASIRPCSTRARTTTASLKKQAEGSRFGSRRDTAS